MDKAILKKFAIESRQDLMQKIESKIKLFYVDETFSKQQNGDVYVLSNEKHSLSLSKEEYEKRELLIKRINELGIEQVIEEAAYTWFNRIVAIRYMEINDYLPLTKDNQSLGIRVLSSKDNTPDPEIMKFTNLTNPELDIDFKKEKYIELKDVNEKFKYVLLLICKKLGRVIQQVFDGVTDYIDILIPDNLLNETGFVNKILTDVPSDNYFEVEILGWLYQYYVSDKKDEAFNKLNKNHQKITKEDLPAVTQMFTPDWIVKLMVDNSIGNSFKNNDINVDTKYVYSLDEKIKLEKLENIKYCDLSCGSGHILIYVFDKLYEAYKYMGYNKNEICSIILNNNIYGLDIDDRAAQLSCLSLILNARKYDKNIFNKQIKLNVLSIIESNNISNNSLNYFKENIKNKELDSVIDYLVRVFIDSKEYGSIIKVENYDYNELIDELMNLKDINKNIFDIAYYDELIRNFLPIIQQAQLLSNKYDFMITNPPYRGIREVDNKLADYLKKEYPNSKYDLYTVFLQREVEMLKENGYGAIIMPNTWLTIGSYNKFRELFLTRTKIETFFDFGPGIFGTDVGSIVKFISMIFRKNSEYSKYNVNYINYKVKQFENEKYMFDIYALPEFKIDFNLSENERLCFMNGKKLEEIVTIAQGMSTSDNDRFLRNWFEVQYDNIEFNSANEEESINSNKKWFPYNKGGLFRKWYGNNGPIINYFNNGEEVKKFATELYNTPSRTIKNTKYFFKESITYTLISSRISARYSKKGYIFDAAGSSIFADVETQKIILALLSTKVALRMLNAINNSYNKSVGDLKILPVMDYNNHKSEIIELVDKCIEIAKDDWDSFETSWDFVKHPFITDDKNIELNKICDNWKEKCNNKILLMKSYEEKLNSIFINIYRLENEISSFVEEKDITLRIADNEKDIKSLISYAVGCMFGRYSLDKDGLVFAGGEFDENNYKTFNVDIDNIIPITDEAYFADDIVARFKDFIEVVYGKETLNENLDFIAETLGKKGTETSEETIRRYFLNDFYSDHIKMYQKKPIYWLFDSGKKNGFKALIYMHRYNENTVPKVRLDYLHRIQNTYDKLLADVNYRLTTELSVSDKKIAQNRQADLNAKLQEINAYDEKIAHISNQRISIDLDDGVTSNYSKFADILAKIK